MDRILELMKMLKNTLKMNGMWNCGGDDDL